MAVIYTHEKNKRGCPIASGPATIFIETRDAITYNYTSQDANNAYAERAKSDQRSDDEYGVQ